MSRLLGVFEEGRSENEAAAESVRAVSQLKYDIGIPERLRDVGVMEEQLATFAETAAGLKRILRVNTCTVDQSDLLGILKSAW